MRLERTWLSAVLLGGVCLAGCPGTRTQAPAPPPSPPAPAVPAKAPPPSDQGSPEAVFKKGSAALAERDWTALAACVSSESQVSMLSYHIGNARTLLQQSAKAG